MPIFLVLLQTAAALAQPPSPSLAQPTARPAAQPATAQIAPGGRLSQVVCITEFQPGSRIVRRRICRTRAEWAEHRLEYRQEIERAQNQFQTSYE
jgi:hypothetical protein